jgi:signal peptidase II
MNMTNHRRLGLIIAAVIFTLDQASKALVTGPLDLAYEGAVHYLLPFFQFTLTHNEGVALGMLPAGSDSARWILTAFLAAITGGVAYWLWTEKSRGDAIGLAFVLGGALGNLLDRIRLGYVTDFLDLHFGEFRPFLVFNLADTAITVGVLVLLARALVSGRSEKKSAKQKVES